MTVSGSTRLRVLDCEVDTTCRLVTGGGVDEPRRLTVKALQVLLALESQRGRVVSREALFERVWPDTMPTDDVLTQAVRQLRRAFGDDHEAPRYIETIAKAGYRLIADTQWLAGSDVDAVAATPQEPATGVVVADATPAEAHVEQGPLKDVTRRRAVPWRVLLLTAALATLAGLVLPRIWGQAGSTAAMPAPVPAQMAVSYQAITSTPGQERLPSLSPDGTTVAYARVPAAGGGSAIVVQQMAQVASRALTRPGDGESDLMPVWSRDGTRIAFVRVRGSECRLMVVAASDGEPTVAGDCPGGTYSHFDWTPDGRGLVMGGARGEAGASAPLQQLDLADGRWRTLDYPIAPGDVDLMPRFSPDGRWLAFRRNISLGDVWMMPAQGGPPRRLTTLRGDIRGWDWLPDGSGLVFSQVTSKAGLHLYRLADGAIRALPQLANGNTVHPDVAGRAWAMVFEIDQSRTGVFRIRLDATGEAEAEPVFASSGVDMLPAISPDGRSLAFVSDRSMSVQLWLGEVDQPATLRAVQGLRPVTRHPGVWSADGRSLLVLGETDEGDRLFEIDAGNGTARRLAIPDASPVFAAYAGDPARLLVGVDGGQGRVRLVLYQRQDWQVLATVDDVAVARLDPASGQVYFTRPSQAGIWRADGDLRNVQRVVATLPAPQHYRHWGLVGGHLYYGGPVEGCATAWQPLAQAHTGPVPCLSRDLLAVAGSQSVDRDGGWLYLGLPITQNIDVGATALPSDPWAQ